MFYKKNAKIRAQLLLRWLRIVACAPLPVVNNTNIYPISHIWFPTYRAVFIKFSLSNEGASFGRSLFH